MLIAGSSNAIGWHNWCNYPVNNVALNTSLPKVSKSNDVQLWLLVKVGQGNVFLKQLKTLKFFESSFFNKLLSPLIKSLNNQNTYKAFSEFSPFFHSVLTEVNNDNLPEVFDKNPKNGLIIIGEQDF